jgi:hypothetical protein
MPAAGGGGARLGVPFDELAFTNDLAHATPRRP